MRWRICAIGDTDIQIHTSLPMYLMYACLTRQLPVVVIALASIILHEAAHALMSAWMGQAPRNLEITMLGAVMRVEDEAALPPMRRLPVLLAGPAATLLLAWLALTAATRSWIGLDTARLIFTSNLCILILNLLPVYPLDGGRLLVLMLERWISRHALTQVVKWTGTVTGCGLILLNLLCCWRIGGWHLSLAAAGCCMIYCAASSSTTYAMTELRTFMDRKIKLECKGCLRTDMVACLHTTPVRHLVRSLPPSRHAYFLCLEAGSMKMLGLFDENILIAHYLSCPHDMAGECLQTSKTAHNGMKLTQTEQD